MKYVVPILAIFAVVVAMNAAIYKLRYDACMRVVDDFYYCIIRP